MSLTLDLALYREFASGLLTVTFIDAVAASLRSVVLQLKRADAGVLTLAWTVDHRRIADHVVAQGIYDLKSNNLKVLGRLR